ncbi:MAG: glycosyltransferase [Candidatus Marinimicrobia bacterium]|nr:glycosyltransferase [Candidatus Neomarinimicrobiota bacterium]
MPKVTVILACYNEEQYIAEALDSILGQTYQDFEVIVINDGSTDKTEEIIEHYANQYPDKILYVSQQNQGQAASINHGFSLASGLYAAFIDGDDTWYPEKLEKQVKVLDDDTEKRIGLVYTYRDQPNLDTTRKRSNTVTVGVRGQVFKRLFMGAFTLNSSIMVPRHIFDKVAGYNPIYPFCPDYEFMLQIAAAGYEFDYIPEILVSRRIHPGNTSRQQLVSNRNNRQMLLDIADRYDDLITQEGVDVDYRMALLDLQLAWHYFVTGNLKQVRQTLTPVLRHYPALVLRSKRYTAYYLLSFFPASWVRRLEGVSSLAPIFKGK